jgi:serine/threonine-protein kinase
VHAVGPWILEDVIAGGGFGKVYRARHRDGRRAAVKVLHAELASIREATARLLREVEAVRRVRHPSVVEVLDAGEEAGIPWYAMELLVGRDLHAVLEERGRLPIDETLAILEPLADALACAHAAGIVHRDVKASNVFLARGRVVLLDFGVA